MYDISAANLVSVRLETGLGSVEFRKRDFAADSSPIRIERVSAVSADIDMEKKLVPRRSLSPVVVSLSPIPNTDTDLKLKRMLLLARNYAANESKAKVSNMEIRFASDGKDNSLTLTDGFEVGGSLGIETLAEGRYATGSYEFQFADIQGQLEASIEWTEWKKAEAEQTQKKQPQKQPQKIRINPKKVGMTFYFGSAANQFNR